MTVPEDVLEEIVAKAERNIDRWGHQPVDALAFAIIEEVGELSQEVLLEVTELPDEADPHALALLEDVRDACLEVQTYLDLAFHDARGEPLPPDERPELLGPIEDPAALLDETGDIGALIVQLEGALEAAMTDGGEPS